MRSFIGLCTLNIYLPEAHTLKDKRAALKSLKDRSRQKFNIAIAEIDYLDQPKKSLLGFTTLSNNRNHTDKMLRSVVMWIEATYPQLHIINEDIEII
jgi:uncharacterized protein YlxP (DUF503 family)